jgi:Na+/H+ antiporter NhaD/arsenite permease-like protein
MPILNFIATEPNRLAMVPFAVLLLAIALGPLIARHHWERHYHKLCLVLAGIVCFYYLLVVKQPSRVVHAGMEYATFIVVVGSFFVVAGGIHLRAKAPSSPLRNTLFLLAGAVLGSLIGTIAASMLLIRPWIAMNRSRIAPMHTAFFIFVVRPAVVARLPQWRAVFLDVATLLATMVDNGWVNSTRFFCS